MLYHPGFNWQRVQDEGVNRNFDAVGRQLNQVAFAIQSGPFADARDFGVRGWPHDDTEEIQKAVDSDAWTIYFPKGQYKITETIVVSGKPRLSIICENPGIALAGPPASPNFLWYGSSPAPMFHFTGPYVAYENISFSIRLEGMHLDGFASGANRATVGLDFGEFGSADPRLIKHFYTNQISVSRCRIGARFGGDINHLADISSHMHLGWALYQNLDYGVLLSSFNCAGILFENPNFCENGYAPTADAINPTGDGANVGVFAGEVTFINGISVGQGAYKPTTADIYVPGTPGFDGFGLKIYGWWSDVHGPFLVQERTLQTIKLSGVRHWEGSMNDVNTPTSIWHNCKLFLDGCYFFGDIYSKADYAGSITALATTFHSADIATTRPTLGIGTFKGDLVTTHHALLSDGPNGRGNIPRNILIPGLKTYANNAAAIAAGEPIGSLYITGADPDVICVVH